MFNFFKNKKFIFNNNKSYLYDEFAAAKNAEVFFSFIDRLPNPDIILRKAGKNISVLRRLINHYQAGACIEQRISGTKSKKFFLNENGTNKEHYNFYKEIFDNTDILNLISNILDAPLYGYAPIEIIWEKFGNYIYPVKYKAKPQEWFYFNSDGEFFFKDRTQGGKRLIDLETGYKFLLPRNNPTEINPYGNAILSRCFWNVAFINGGMEFWVKCTEKYGMPQMIGKYDRSMTDKEKTDFLSALVNMVQDAVGLIPSDGSVEIMQSASGASSEIYEKLVNKCENNIAKAILGQTLTTDIGSTGSYAASQTHLNIRADIIDSDRLLVEKTINTLIKYINDINFGDNVVPMFEFEQPQNLGTDKAERDNKVAALGVKFSKKYLCKTYGYSEDDIEIVENRVMNYEENNNEKPEKTTKPLENLDILENLTDEKEIEKCVSGEIKKIAEFLNATKDYDEALNQLAELYPEFDFKSLEKALTKVIFISDILGRIEVQNNE